MKTSKMTTIVGNMLCSFNSTIYYHTKYIDLKIGSHNHNRGYKIAITVFATAVISNQAQADLKKTSKADVLF